MEWGNQTNTQTCALAIQNTQSELSTRPHEPIDLKPGTLTTMLTQPAPRLSEAKLIAFAKERAQSAKAFPR